MPPLIITINCNERKHKLDAYVLFSMQGFIM